jgi:hypothetical protein
MRTPFFGVFLLATLSSCSHAPVSEESGWSIRVDLLTSSTAGTRRRICKSTSEATDLDEFMREVKEDRKPTGPCFVEHCPSTGIGKCKLVSGDESLRREFEIYQRDQAAR